MAVLENAEGVRVEVAPEGPTAPVAAEIVPAILAHPVLQRYLGVAEDRGGAEPRLLSLRLLDDLTKESETAGPSDRFVATVYDYANHRALEVEGRLGDLEGVVVRESGAQPRPSAEEFQVARRLLLGNGELRRAADAGELRIYQPMPPLLRHELPDGRTQRVVTLGLYTPGGHPPHRLVGVNLHTGQVLPQLPGFRRLGQLECGAPVAQDPQAKELPGKIRLKVSHRGAPTWDLVAVRPSASSGTNGSGTELGRVDYRGRRVLHQAHVPILNVRYPGGGCDPSYRDWQDDEAYFQADGTDVIPGIRLCPSPAATILDTGSDEGDFGGVAIFIDGLEVVLVSEMRAGWYRYISEWRLHVDGTIRPRFGFAATSNDCTCYNHVHHAYWRLDFDIETAGNNVVREHNDPPLVGNSPLHTHRYEIRRLRDAAHRRHWEVSNPASGAGYRLVPGDDDGFADAFGVGDLWVLRYHPGEIDDGQEFTTDPTKSTAHLDRFVNGEVVEGQDVVVWYVGHFVHSFGARHGSGHRVGPELQPLSWPGQPG